MPGYENNSTQTYTLLMVWFFSWSVWFTSTLEKRLIQWLQQLNEHWCINYNN